MLGIIGRNGAGKISVPRVIAGIMAPDRGRVEVDGFATLLSINAGFAPQLSGRDNIVLVGMLYGLPWKRTRRLADDIIDFAELADAIDKPLYTYSSGMRARLGFSIAMNARPDIVLLDETLSVGDAWFQRKSRDALSWMMSANRAVIIASHNVAMLRTLCHRVVWIDDGKARAIGDANSVLEQYARAVNTGRRKSGFKAPGASPGPRDGQ